MTKSLRLGTRASPLAMAQAHLVRDALCAAHGWALDRVEIVSVTASGDKILDRALAEVGGKALWTKELDAWLMAGDIDLAVHSMKDVETIRPSELHIAAMLPRGDARDRLVGAASLGALRPGACIGTSSPRRTAQLKRMRPDLEIVLLRGNVGSRLAKIEAGDADATLLAAAGLDRLGMGEIGVAINIARMIPAPSQGAIGVEVHVRHSRSDWWSAIDHAATRTCVETERRWLAAIGGDCHSCVAAHARIVEGEIQFSAEIISPDGLETVARTVTRPDIPALASEMLKTASPALRAMFTA